MCTLKLPALPVGTHTGRPLRLHLAVSAQHSVSTAGVCALRRTVPGDPQAAAVQDGSGYPPSFKP